VIRPQSNAFRDRIDLSGVWRVRFDPDGMGEVSGWSAGIGEGFAIAVPGSWNEQLAEAGFMNYVGAAWLETEVFVPVGFEGRRIDLRFGSADYEARVWADGVYLGSSGPAMLPFELDATAAALPGQMLRIVVRVSNELPVDGPTQRVTRQDYVDERRIRDEYLPTVRFDFFPYGGLNRPVHLTATPRTRIEAVRVTPGLKGGQGTLRIEADLSGGAGLVATVSGHGQEARTEGVRHGHLASLTMDLADVRPWSSPDPALYRLMLDLLDAVGGVVDRVEMDIGFRDIRIDGSRLLLNGGPVQLRGFGKHEDSPIRGRGLDLPLLVRDFQLLRWTGANSVRTSHYPYSEEFLDFADREGILVIGEAFSINLDFRRVTDATLAAHKAAVEALIHRDMHRPSVIAWSLANEPGYLAEPEYRERSGPYWKALFDHARAVDASRPLTHANVGYAGIDDPAFDVADICSINRYYGWYQSPGRIEEAAALLRADLDHLAERGKPLFVAEFGADALAGQHSTTDQLFTEEYQADLIAAFWGVIADHPACIGGHVWNFADFRTAQHGRRVVVNLKGVFTRDRQPKRAAFRLRDLWTGTP
jgi:beta-glucuronidase